ncbi:hypothetical protein CZ794_03335 [Psychrobacter sp. JB385]|nr:hypothetical protein CZ794_03335 [Psychrobacter sp. JB385]
MLYSLAMLMNACIDSLASRSIIIIDVLVIKTIEHIRKN